VQVFNLTIKEISALKKCIYLSVHPAPFIW